MVSYVVYHALGTCCFGGTKPGDALSLLIWAWTAVLSVKALQIALALTLSLAHRPGTDPMFWAASAGTSFAFGLVAFFCLRRVARERRIPIGSQAYQARQDSAQSDTMFQQAITLEGRSSYDAALALYRRIARVPVIQGRR